jgi:hypothetical protein
MNSEEAAELEERANGLTLHERTPTAKELGERQRLTAVQRERLKLWPIAPFDVTL